MLMRRRSIRGLMALMLLALAAAPWPTPAAQAQVPSGVISLEPVGGVFPINMDVNETTNRVYVVNRNSNNVSVINGLTNTFITNVPVGASPFDVAVNQATNRVYVVNDGPAPAVTVIDGASNTAVTTIPLISNVTPPGAADELFIAVNPNTNTIYVSDSARNQLFVI